ncbi:MAG TPA: class I adenylate-forming enzyme family protein [Acidimicrobiales bacterium]|nr:class I adenylate-forming enzyme family protein [Acidimicrobiales bacterium]
MSPPSDLEGRRAQLDARHRPWTATTLAAFLDRVAAQHPDRPWVVGEHATYSYDRMAQWSRRLAKGLVAGGVGVGDRVALFLPNGAELIAARFAVARAGAVAVPINFRLQAQELAYILDHCEPTALITMEAFREVDALDALDRIAPGWDRRGATTSVRNLRLVVTVPAGGQDPRRPGVPTLADLEGDGDEALDAELEGRGSRSGPDEMATIFYTSGTTGRPKGVMSTHDMELRSAYGSAYTRGFEDGRRIVFALPLNHVFAYVEGLLASMFVAGSVVVQSAFDPDATLTAIERHRANEALFVPTMSLAVVEAARRRSADLTSLHSVMSAASSAPARLWTDLYDVLGVEQCVTAYGMTETSAATTFTEPGGPVDDLVGTVGRPKAGGAAGDPDLGGRLAEYKTVDPVTLGDLPAGAEGELVARGPIVCRGYYRQPEATAEAMLTGGWLRSGDLGYVRHDGSLVLTGRSKDLYKCGGELVMPVEVEARLTSRPDVAQAYVVGVPDPRMGEVGCAWVVPAEDAKLDPDELIEYCRAGLARFKAPAHVIVTAAGELPLTASGKVQKFVLAERAVARLGREAPTGWA